MSDFSNAKPGDKVYCLLHGEGIIEDKVHLKSLTYYNPLISVQFNDTYKSLVRYTYDGYRMDGTVLSKEPLLYWIRPEIIEKKRKIKKSGWINIFQQASDRIFLTGVIYNSYDEAKERQVKTKFWQDTLYLDTVKIEFEVEE